MQVNQLKSNLPKYRTITQCYAEIKKIDSDCCLSLWFVRQLCKSGKIQYFSSGKKSLVNYSDLLKYLGYAEEQ